MGCTILPSYFAEQLIREEVLCQAGESFIPLAGVTRHSRSARTSDMHTEAANALPRGFVLCDEGGFCPRHFPFLADEQVTTRHVVYRNATPPLNLFEVVTKPCRHTTRADGLPNIDGVLVLIENVDAKLPWGFGRSQGVLRARLHLNNKLVGKGPIDIEDKLVSIAHGDTRIALKYFLCTPAIICAKPGIPDTRNYRLV